MTGKHLESWDGREWIDTDMWQAKFSKLQGGGKEIISLTGETSAELCHDKGDLREM
jgi:hypothetical protein